MRVCAALAAVCGWACLAGAGEAVSRPADAGALEAPAVAALNHSARSLGHLGIDSVVGGAARIRVLLEAAERLRPDDLRTSRQLVDLYEGLGDLKAAASAAERYVRARPGDHAMAVRWMRLAQAHLDRADERIDLLKGFAAREALGPGTRAAAAAALCGVYFGQGERSLAASACRQALELDPCQAEALRAQATLTKNAAPADVFRRVSKGLQAACRNLGGLWRLAQMLQGAGGHAEALRLYEHAYAILRQKPPSPAVAETLVVDYVNAMLDAGQARQAVDFFRPLLAEYGHSLALRALMAEACTLLGDDEQTRSHVEFMDRVYARLTEGRAKPTSDQAAELAWFNLRYNSRPKVALEWAKAAAISAADDPYVQRVLGAAELATGHVQAGVKRLGAVAAEDPYAAALLARRSIAEGEPAEAAKTVRKAADNPRTGPAWRELAAVARELKLDLPAVDYAENLKRALAEVPDWVFEMGRWPERFVRVKLVGPDRPPLPGEPVAVTVELNNIGPRPVALGPEGLFAPVVSLSLTAEGPGKVELPALTPVPLPAPRYLPPGQTVSETVRVDVGRAEKLLMAEPLAEMKLTLSGVLDPLERDGEMTSSVPTVPIVPITITRPALFDVSEGERAARLALGYIVRDLRQGDLPAKLRAARQTAALLGYVRKVERKQAKPIHPGVLTKPVLLSMTRAFLRAESPLVRAEMLAALRHVDLDASVIALMGPRVNDESALVRMRLIELLAGKRTAGHETLLRLYARDTDAGVREMAAALTAER